MHPVLKSALVPLAEQLEAVSAEEARIAPLPGQDRWSACQIMEHLILSYELTSSSVSRRLRTGRVPKNKRSLLQFLLRLQTIGVGYMPNGVYTIRSLRPADCDFESGAEIAARFLKTAEEMDGYLVEARKRFGIQACGEHPIFGVMRVDEWRRYHAVHARHHSAQLRHAIRFAKTQKVAV
jgi:hypothetical protein